jgi:UDP-N-acetylmuramyl pentapeptide phosphotransferase/UDP-N-acetylglucosamine-1-phosphate transferase
LTVVFFGVFFLSLLFSLVLTRYVRDVASSRGWVALPTTERHLHLTPLPRLGGVAIFTSFSLSMVAAVAVCSYIPRLHSAFSSRTLATILLPASIIFLLGVYDDLRSVGPYISCLGFWVCPSRFCGWWRLPTPSTSSTASMGWRRVPRCSRPWLRS